MASGRGSCMKVLCFSLLIALCSTAIHGSTTHVVGDSNGWGFSVSYTDWADGKDFVAGDTLVFNYNQGQHNVVPVNAAAYRSCKAPSNSKPATSGNDKVTLKKGPNYFLCSLPGHCQAGMKLLANAS
ncbi:hypothetical protein AMTRI_Chr07g75390 [Amborella trichopoda]|uniref:Plantacyanin n=1 Tax=Amborella trichopoda TaxID=13333 RepID=U5D9C1_AMBTC|nr:basic blue protein [Amborella trichopoda]ERN18830.1 hypothetical protein AMTR_s00067p00118460 [Amborella trichopoda]|eukprot:XP_006857363.1 basic blue protein [Amborella trichopoda]